MSNFQHNNQISHFQFNLGKNNQFQSDQSIIEQLLNETQQNQSLQSEDLSDPNIYNNYSEYLFSLIGFAVGFGSFWRFPYLVYKNGGGAFLIPYFIGLIFFGVPLLYLQTVVGQFYRCSQPFIFCKINKGLKYLGYTFILISLGSSYYYNLIMAYSYRYLLTAFSWQLPYQNQSPLDNRYFQQEFLNKSDSIQNAGDMNYYIWILYIVSMIVCFYIVKNGVKTSGRIIVWTAIIPYLFFAILLIRGLFLQGAYDGLSYLFVPKFQKLLNIGIWVDAFVQVFYQISIGCGTVINFSSMKRRRQKFLQGIFYIPLSFVICSLICGMIAFMYLGHFCYEQGILIDQLTISGPQLSFNVFPKALTILPLPNLWVFLFFSAMIFLGIDTQFGFLQTVYCCLKDQFKQIGSLRVFTFVLSQEHCKYLIVFLLLAFSPPLASSAGIYYMEFLDYFINSIPLSLGALIQIYVFVYLVPFNEIEWQIIKYRNETTPKWIRYVLQSKQLLVMLSINLIFAIIDQINLAWQYPLKYYLFGWVLTIYPYVIAFIYFKRYCQSKWNLTFEDIERNNLLYHNNINSIQLKNHVISKQKV